MFMTNIRSISLHSTPYDSDIRDFNARTIQPTGNLFVNLLISDRVDMPLRLFERARLTYFTLQATEQQHPRKFHTSFEPPFCCWLLSGSLRLLLLLTGIAVALPPHRHRKKFKLLLLWLLSCSHYSNLSILLLFELSWVHSALTRPQEEVEESMYLHFFFIWIVVFVVDDELKYVNCK